MTSHFLTIGIAGNSKKRAWLIIDIPCDDMLIIALTVVRLRAKALAIQKEFCLRSIGEDIDTLAAIGRKVPMSE